MLGVLELFVAFSGVIVCKGVQHTRVCLHFKYFDLHTCLLAYSAEFVTSKSRTHDPVRRDVCFLGENFVVLVGYRKKTNAEICIINGLCAFETDV